MTIETSSECSPARARLSGLTPEVAKSILEAVAGLQYGAVEITVHDSQVVQIERREKTRFGRTPRSSRRE